MHELSLAAEVLRLVRQAAVREGFERVARLRLEAGALSGVQASALHFALQAIAPGTCLEGAAIEIDEPPGRGWCAVCVAEVAMPGLAEPCPRCGAFGLQPTQGAALRVVDLLVQPAHA